MVESKCDNSAGVGGIDRRKFLRSTAAAGAGLILTPMAAGQTSKAKKKDALNIAWIGLGVQYERLRDSILGREHRIDETENLHFKAICDIWPMRRTRQKGLLKAFKHNVNAYESYEELLDKEKDLDAVIIATPEWTHAPITIACLKAGLHVYCEKEMSNNLAEAKKMVQAAKETGKLLQIGHQRRSNPRYQAARGLVREHKLLGKVKNINSQWNKSVESHAVPLPANKKVWMDKESLKKHGYGSMQELVNWRWYEKYGGGPLGDLGSHQIDIFNWFLGEVRPKSVMAVGGKDYYNYQHNENVMVIYEYETKDYGGIRAFYQVLNTTFYGTYGQYHEVFMGDVGTLLISEIARGKNHGWMFLEDWAKKKPEIAKKWDECIQKKLIGGAYELPKEHRNNAILQLGGSTRWHNHPLVQKLDAPVHQPHLKNFFDAIRDKNVKLNCPGEIGYETAVTVLTANEAIKTGGKIKFTAEDFKV